MIAKACVKFIRISPRKVRYVIDLIREKKVSEAQGILNGTPRRAGEIIRKLLNQALDAAQKNSQVAAKDLMVSKVMADGGPMMKRFRAASMGRASVIRKRTSHITLELDLAKKGGVMPQRPATAAAAKQWAGPVSNKLTAQTAGTKKINKKLVGAK